MKKYFAKYLPVDGKVEIGDKFIDTEVMNLIGTRTNKEGVYDFQKVKLFLCSRDVQVGDTFKINVSTISSYLEDRVCTAIVEDPFGEHKGKKMYMINDTGAHLKEGECFKVIGEISPQATWVKEGDEFDEDDLEEEIGFFETVRIKIKGPCGHFH